MSLVKVLDLRRPKIAQPNNKCNILSSYLHYLVDMAAPHSMFAEFLFEFGFVSSSSCRTAGHMHCNWPSWLILMFEQNNWKRAVALAGIPQCPEAETGYAFNPNSTCHAVCSVGWQMLRHNWNRVWHRPWYMYLCTCTYTCLPIHMHLDSGCQQHLWLVLFHSCHSCDKSQQKEFKVEPSRLQLSDPFHRFPISI